MKLISFLRSGSASFGVVVGENVLDLKPLLGSEAADLKTVIEKNLVSLIKDLLASHQPNLKLVDLTLLPVIPNPDKIVCVGLNYHDHVKETGRDLTEKPAIFLRLNDSQVAHGQNIVRPMESHRLDYEGEIAVII